MARESALDNLAAYEAGRERAMQLYLHASRRHINEFLGWKCASDLLVRGVFPNGKEITESMGAFHAVRRFSPWRFDDPSVTLAAIGDGVTPRTAALFAFRSKWDCISIDPAMRMQGYQTERLQVVAGKAEDYNIACDKLVVVAVHSHAPLHQFVRNCAESGVKEMLVVAIPCCTKNYLEMRGQKLMPRVSYLDHGIWSPKNEVLVWGFSDASILAEAPPAQ